MHDYLDEYQRMAVKALEEFKTICDENNIRYYLLAGTVLGAVRHQGMIPWDDDIDVGLLYEDWYRIKGILSRKSDEKFIYVDCELDGTFPRLFGKILYKGRSCIDIFLLVKWTSNPLIGNIHWQIRRLATTNFKYTMHYKTVPRKNFTRKQKVKFMISESCRKVLYWSLQPFFHKDDYVRLARWNEKYFEQRDTDYYINIYSIYPMKKEMMEKAWIENISYVEFEEEQYTTVGDVHAYLTHLYGDYMTPPPLKYRHKEHQEEFELVKTQGESQ